MAIRCQHLSGEAGKKSTVGVLKMVDLRDISKDGKQRAAELFWWVTPTFKEHVTPPFLMRHDFKLLSRLHLVCMKSKEVVSSACVQLNF